MCKFAPKINTSMKQPMDFLSFHHYHGDGYKMKKVALACPHDAHTQEVIVKALECGLARFSLFAHADLQPSFTNAVAAYQERVTVVSCADAEDAARKAVAEVKAHRADILMKGSLNTDVLLRAALDKQTGILESGRVMSHIAVSHIPGREKPLVFSDAAVIPRPTLGQFDAIVSYCVEACRKIGVSRPKVALINFSEKVNPKFEHTLSYQEIIRRAENGRYGDVVIGGPMDVKTACDAESGMIKGIVSPVVGNADILIFPNIESGNTFYKTISLFADAITAGWLVGTEVPVVVSSRADSVESKFSSLTLACLQ